MPSYSTIFAILCCFSSTVLFVTTIFIISPQTAPEIIVKEDTSHLKLEPNPEITGPPSTCKLPNVDPWNEEIIPYVDLDYHLDTTWNSYINSSLQNGTVSVNFHSYGYGSCSARCIIRNTEFTNDYGPWLDITEKFDCDLIHVSCKFYYLYVFPYSYERLHHQIVPVKRSVPAHKKKKHSIYVITIDSTSHGQSYRNLPKSILFMKEKFGAVSFPYVNKIAANSRPNGFSLLLGKSIVGIGSNPPDLDDQKVCNEPMDAFKTIFDDMREVGYRTLYSEDWASYYYTFPNCTGFKRKVFDHTLTPLIQEESIHNPKLQVEYEIYDMQRNQKPKRTLQLMDHLSNFMKAYEGEPKFGWIWTIDLSHDKQSTSIALDTMIYKLLVENQKELQNSYVFIMGLRFGKEQSTKTARIELVNPMLTFSIPMDLRTKEIKKLLKNNSKHLVTHYDTRATWLDIAKFQQNYTAIDSKYMKIHGEKGESYLRTQTENRTCQNLPIPSVYCMCESEREDLPTNSTDAFIMGQRVITEINNYLADMERDVKLCGKWKLAEIVSLQGVKPTEKTGVYYITVRAGEPYNKAEFSTIISVSSTGDMEIGPIDRVDRYENRGDCATVPRFCHCI